MPPLRIAALASGLALSLSVAAGPAAASPVEGIWLTEDGVGRVKIAPCPEGVCGSIVDDGPLNNRPLLLAFRGGPQVFVDGVIIDPRNGRRYQGRLRVLDGDRLQVTGCLIGPLCASQIWRRAPTARS